TGALPVPHPFSYPVFPLWQSRRARREQGVPVLRDAARIVDGRRGGRGRGGLHATATQAARVVPPPTPHARAEAEASPGNRSLRGLVPRVPGVGAWPRLAGRADAERLGHAGTLPRPRDPAPPGAGARPAQVDRATRSHGAGGPGLPREGRRRLPEDRRGAPRT